MKTNIDLTMNNRNNAYSITEVYEDDGGCQFKLVNLSYENDYKIVWTLDEARPYININTKNNCKLTCYRNEVDKIMKS